MDKVIVILVMIEEKWVEANYLRNAIEKKGFKTMMLDMGLTGKPQGFADISREEVILASGKPSGEVMRIVNRGERMLVMVEGGKNILNTLYSQDKLSGIVSIGGATGTQMGTSMMRSLPFGIPKLAVSSTASVRGLAERYISTKDITLMHTVVEFGGLDKLLKNVLNRAAGAICGMVEASIETPISVMNKENGAMVAMTHFGPCECCAMEVRRLLESKGYQVIGFSAAGIGDRAMEEIIEQNNIFDAVIDLAPGGVGEELLGFTRAAGPYRLEAAGKKGLPQIITTCGVNLGSPRFREYKPEYENRKKYRYDALRTFMRLSSDELVRVAQVIADKINKAKGPVKILIPLSGWSSMDKKGTPFYDGGLDEIFVNELAKNLKSGMELKRIHADLDTLEFAKEVVKTFEEIV